MRSVSEAEAPGDHFRVGPLHDGTHLLRMYTCLQPGGENENLAVDPRQRRAPLCVLHSGIRAMAALAYPRELQKRATIFQRSRRQHFASPFAEQAPARVPSLT